MKRIPVDEFFLIFGAVCLVAMAFVRIKHNRRTP